MKLRIAFQLALSLLVTVSASAQSTLGQKIQLVNDSSGTPSIGVQYATQSSKMFAITFSVMGRSLVGEISKSIAPAQWAVFNKNTGTQLSSWTDLQAPAALLDPNSTQGFTIAVSSATEIQSVAGALKDAALVLSLNTAPSNPVPSVYIDLGALCVSSPSKFMNLDTFATGCN